MRGTLSLEKSFKGEQNTVWYIWFKTFYVRNNATTDTVEILPESGPNIESKDEVPSSVIYTIISHMFENKATIRI